MLERLDGETPIYLIDEEIGRVQFEGFIALETDEIAGVFEGDRLVLQPKRGLPDEVGFVDEEVPLLKDRVVTHNHPKGGPPSAADVFLAAEADVRELRTVTPTGTVYAIVRPKGGWPASDTLVGAVERSIDALRRVNAELLREKRPLLTTRDENELFYRERKAGLAELGVELRKTDRWQ